MIDFENTDTAFEEVEAGVELMKDGGAEELGPKEQHELIYNSDEGFA